MKSQPCEKSPRPCWQTLLTSILAAGTVAICMDMSEAGERVPWTSSQMTGSLVPPPDYRVQRVFPELLFQNPVSLTKAPGTGHLFLLQLDGKVFRLPLGEGAADLVADLQRDLVGVQQVFGIAFHPRFEENRFVYLCYTRDGDEDHGTCVSRFHFDDAAVPQLDPASEQRILTWRRGGHNGGCLKFGQDGYLYISAGDAGPAFPPDPLRAGQDLSNVLSTIMRIDVDRPSGAVPYSIPADNPFVTLEGARPEIWAYGFRNPWRMAFDELTGDLWVGDVGWELWEMIQRVQPGDNYGWSLVEGPHTVHEEGRRGPTPITAPVAVHSHTEARSITGGQVYRGSRLPELVGAYLYGDHVTGKIWAIRRQGDTFTTPKEIARTPLKIICFGIDHDGEVYVVGYGGTIHRLERNEVAATNRAFPRTLAQTGIFESVREHRLADGVLPYRINAEPWMDGATATRFLGIPGDARISVYTDTAAQDIWAGRHNGAWKFPADTVLGKTISLENRRIETQVLHYDGQEWQPYTYVWNDEQTDAQLAEHGPQTIEVPRNGQPFSWEVVSRTECMVCHSSAAGMVLGFKPDQLDGVRPGATENQLAFLESLAFFEQPVRREKPLVDPYDVSQHLERRARSYLHVNCAHCHRREGGGAAAMDVRFEQPMDGTHLLNERPTQGTFFIHDPAVVTPGDPYRSVMYYRLAKLGRGRMPYFGTSEVDVPGLSLVHDWIAALDDVDPATSRSLREFVQTLQASQSDDQLTLEACLRDTRHSLMLATAIDAGLVDEAFKTKLLALSRDADPHIRDLFERFLPNDLRTRVMGSSVDPARILALSGDVGRGAQLFEADSLSCKTCHAVQAGALRLGPNLATLPPEQYRSDVLLQNLLEPSRSIKDEYMAYLVQTTDGRVFSGLIKDEIDYVVLRDQRNEEMRISRGDIELLRQQQKSLMPDRMLSQLTEQQAADLLAYLVDLGETPMITGVHHAQITIPRNSEEAGRAFYCDLLGLVEIPKPESLIARGGFWLAVGQESVHVGVEDGVDRIKTKAHLAYVVTDLQHWRRRLTDAGIEVIDGVRVPGCDRFEFRDPFGNRIEMVQPHGAHARAER